MKIDCSKLSNKDDLVVLLSMIVIFVLFAFTLYLAANNNTFLSGFSAATIIWKWKPWFYEPIDKFLEKNWTFSQNVQ
jgi:hypothetical protein